tara:strand:- start:161 stop:595 length:435 start_codon:yes stop_codon:yes gene_type:complete
MEYIMKKTIIIIATIALTALWGQKEIPIGGNENEEISDERLSGHQALTIDPEMIQEIRAVKASMEKIHIKKQMMSATPSGPKSFKVSNSESRFAAIKEIIEQIKKEESEQKMSSIKVLNKNNSVNKTRKSSNNIFDTDRGSSRN